MVRVHIPAHLKRLFYFLGERDEFEKYYRKQRRQQATLTLQPPANMHESIDG